MVDPEAIIGCVPERATRLPPYCVNICLINLKRSGYIITRQHATAC